MADAFGEANNRKQAEDHITLVNDSEELAHFRDLAPSYGLKRVRLLHVLSKWPSFFQYGLVQSSRRVITYLCSIFQLFKGSMQQ